VEIHVDGYARPSIGFWSIRQPQPCDRHSNLAASRNGWTKKTMHGRAQAAARRPSSRQANGAIGSQGCPSC